VIDFALAMRPFGFLRKLVGGKAPRQGTPSYMSPEQIRCESPAPSADIYSFGITCYEMACGRPPFRANSQTELLQKHLSERPSPPSMHNPAITPEFSDLVLKMIQKKPSDRLASLEDFRMAFMRVRIYKDDPDPMPSRGYP
jgi:serine/threonine protein kinase